MERGKDGISVRKLREEEKWKRERGKGKETRWKGKSEGEKREKREKEIVYGAAVLDHELEREAGACVLDVAMRGNSVLLHQSPTLSSWWQLPQSPHPIVGTYFFLYSAYNFYDFALKQKIRKKKSYLCGSEFWDLFWSVSNKQKLPYREHCWLLMMYFQSFMIIKVTQELYKIQVPRLKNYGIIGIHS